MDISITLPDDVAKQMQSRWQNLPRRALEALVADGYRAQILTSAQVQHILGLESRWEVEEFLYQAGAPLGYGEKELEEDLEAQLDDEKIGRERFESHFGAVDLGHSTGADNERIDADLAKAYSAGAEDSSLNR